VTAPTPGTRLIRRLREKHGIDIPDSAYVRRTGAGRHQLAGGAWRWHMFASDDAGHLVLMPYGSQYTITELLRCRAWVIEQPTSRAPDANIDPCDGCARGLPCAAADPDSADG
jgi:hypothetical protein